MRGQKKFVGGMTRGGFGLVASIDEDLTSRAGVSKVVWVNGSDGHLSSFLRLFSFPFSLNLSKMNVKGKGDLIEDGTYVPWAKIYLYHSSPTKSKLAPVCTRQNTFRCTGSSCAACTYKRKRCQPWCEYAQIFRDVISRQDYRTIFTVFGVKNVADILQHIPEYQYLETLNSFLFEAKARVENPIKGCTALLASLEQKYSLLHNYTDQIRTKNLNYDSFGETSKCYGQANLFDDLGIMYYYSKNVLNMTKYEVQV
ncbi:hypothetical protein LguiB_008887 [Lonicera macranthoides]